MLHNLCYLHAAISLRSRFGLGGWNTPSDFHQIGFSELLVCVTNTRLAHGQGEEDYFYFIMTLEKYILIGHSPGIGGVKFTINHL